MCAVTRAVFRLFGRPKHGVTADIFQRQIHTRLGIILTDDEAEELFAQFDVEGVSARVRATGHPRPL